MCKLLKTFLLLFSSFIFLSAQTTSDTQLRIANSFEKLYENPDIAIHAAKEIREEKNDLFTKDILAQAYLTKGEYLESVKIGFEKSSLKKGNQERLTQLIIAREFYHLNLYDQTTKLIEMLISDQKSETKDQGLYAQIYQLQTKNFIALKQFDYAKKSLLKSKFSTEHHQKSHSYISKENELLDATIELGLGNHKVAKRISDSLLQDLSSLPRANYLFALTQQFRAQLFFKNQEYSQAIECLKSSLLSIENLNYNPLKSLIYQNLAINYLAIKDSEEYLFYNKKYNESSKLLEANKKEARRQLIELSTELTVENNKKVLSKKKSQLFYTLAISLILLSLMVYIFIREILKSKILFKQIRFFRTIKSNQNLVPVIEVKINESAKKQLVIPKEKEEEILEGLQRFEKSKKYLDNNMSLPTLAGELNTNIKYLSEIINKYKHKNFNTYINELRVKHIIQLISEDRSYLQYKISYIAEIGGFTSHSAFTNIFKTVTGMSPNDYIQTLRQQS